MSFLECKECGSTLFKLGTHRNLMFLLLKWKLIITPKYYLQHQNLVLSWKPSEYLGPRSWVCLIFCVHGGLSRTDLGLETYQVHKPSPLSPDQGMLSSPSLHSLGIVVFKIKMICVIVQSVCQANPFPVWTLNLLVIHTAVLDHDS